MTDRVIEHEWKAWIKTWLRAIGGRPDGELYSIDTVHAAYVAGYLRATEDANGLNGLDKQYRNRVE